MELREVFGFLNGITRRETPLAFSAQSISDCLGVTIDDVSFLFKAMVASQRATLINLQPLIIGFNHNTMPVSMEDDYCSYNGHLFWLHGLVEDRNSGKLTVRSSCKWAAYSTEIVSRNMDTITRVECPDCLNIKALSISE